MILYFGMLAVIFLSSFLVLFLSRLLILLGFIGAFKFLGWFWRGTVHERRYGSQFFKGEG